MKMLSEILFNGMSKAFLQHFTATAEETLSTEFNSSQRRLFSSADLWNIQRRRRSIVIR
ncbi:MAG: hypothetical protein ABIN36_08015 [Ferruginibacter sp.]